MSPGEKSVVWTGLSEVSSFDFNLKHIAPFNKFPSLSVIGTGAPAIKKAPKQTLLPRAHLWVFRLSDTRAK